LSVVEIGARGVFLVLDTPQQAKALELTCGHSLEKGNLLI
jgi:hypothetical protein